MADKKDKKPKEKKKKPGRKMHELYTISGDKIERKNRTCPKCGPGMFVAKHKNRSVCGKCGYMEMGKKEESKEEVKEEKKETKEESKE